MDIKDQDLDHISSLSSTDKQLDYLSSKYPNAKFEVDEGGSLSMDGIDLPKPSKFGEITITIPQWLSPSPKGFVPGQNVGEGKLPPMGSTEQIKQTAKQLAGGLPMLGAGAAAALLPETAPWWIYGLASGAGAGLGKTGSNAIQGEDLGKGVAGEAALSTLGGAAAKPLSALFAGALKGASKLSPAIAKLVVGSDNPAAIKMGVDEASKPFSSVTRNIADNLNTVAEDFSVRLGVKVPKSLDVELRNISNMSTKDFANMNPEKVIERIKKASGGSLDEGQQVLIDKILKDGLVNFQKEVQSVMSAVAPRAAGQGLSALDKSLGGMTGLSTKMSQALGGAISQGVAPAAGRFTMSGVRDAAEMISPTRKTP
jgi:hypothetical protein